MNLSDIPQGTILGINYSGAHDSSIAAVSPYGEPIWAASLERFSRIKQDGRPPFQILDLVPWEKVATVAISTERTLAPGPYPKSKLLHRPLTPPRSQGLQHQAAFYALLNKIPRPLEFVCHQISHSASAFWCSDFESSLCLTYDGGMHNSPWFGGLYKCDHEAGIIPLDQFSAIDYPKITSLYTFVTALLGFTPNKHEGKITGLAAYGKPDPACRKLLERWLYQNYYQIEAAMEWAFGYDDTIPPSLSVREHIMQPFRDEAAAFSSETLAWAVQAMAEDHVLDIIQQAKSQGWNHSNMCLSGGLFSNVKINQRVVESGFDNLFVAPPMTDDGTALGAALHVAAQAGIKPRRKVSSMLLGTAPDKNEIEQTIKKYNLKATQLAEPSAKIAQLLHEGQVVAVVHGRMEFGPRALCNRSILAAATSADINQQLNKRLNRTEFMPFAPVSRYEDADDCYLNIIKVIRSAEFMTVTVNCTDEMKTHCPAVVHIDGTARPQLVRENENPFIHKLLTHYVALSGKKALVNTSYNIHEEPIICTADDAIRGFLESGIDYLYLDGGWLIKFTENTLAAALYLQQKKRTPSTKSQTLQLVNTRLNKAIDILTNQLREKEQCIQQFNKQLTEKEAEIKNNISAYSRKPPDKPAPLWPKIRRCVLKFIFKTPYPLGVLRQYEPKQLRLSTSIPKTPITPNLGFCILTPSYNQGKFIERTITSVLNQQYPQLRHGIQDGGSTDDSCIIIKKFAHQLAYSDSRPDSGQAAAISYGFAQMSPRNDEIMAWLNSDDTLLPGTLNIVADYFDKNPDIDVIYGHRIIINEADEEVGRWYLPPHNNKTLKWVDYVPQETLFWRASAWTKVDGINPNFQFAMDWDLLARFEVSGLKIKRIPYFLGCFRVHDHQKTHLHINSRGLTEMNEIRDRLNPQNKNKDKAIRDAATIEARRSAVTYRLQKISL
jgi:carbamoyltransferase